MDVTIEEWPEKVQAMLSHISRAHFVALDFEISGISMKRAKKEAQQSTSRKQSLQERYRDVREAAEKYQILQVGITTVFEDPRSETYILRPYNINLSPVFEEPSVIERDFTSHSSTTEFLLRYGFDFQKAFVRGIPYLSREEEERVRLEETLAKNEAVAEFILYGSELKHLEFVRGIRAEIKKWLQEDIEEVLNIHAVTYHAAMKGGKRFTRLQRRLVHQLVRIEFPDLNSENSSDDIEIRYRDRARHSAEVHHRQAILESKIQRQIGLRYLMEGLVTGNGLDSFDPKWWPNLQDKASSNSDMMKIDEQIQTIKQRLRNPTVLVGHNVFTDLVNFYSCFIGKLPEDVHEFREEIHKLFPMVIDTKYLATPFTHLSRNGSTLERLDIELEEMDSPKITCHPHHARYNLGEKHLHEAGYDSLVTARVAIRLSTVLEESLTTSSQAKPPPAEPKKPELIPVEEQSPLPKTALQELEELFGKSAVVGKAEDVHCEIESHSADESQPDDQSEEVVIPGFMPRFRSQFWQTWGNRVLVNGTSEGVLDLGQWSMFDARMSDRREGQ